MAQRFERRLETIGFLSKHPIDRAPARHSTPLTLWQASNRGVWKRLAVLALLIVGCILLVRAFADVSWRDLAREMQPLGMGVVLIFAAPLVGNCMHMLGWRALVEARFRPSVGRAFRIFVAAQAGNEVGASILGESVKVAAFSREARPAALVAVVWDNLTSLVALLGILAVGTWVAFVGHEYAGRVIGGFVVLLLLLALGWRLSHRKETPPLVNLCAAFAAHTVGKLWILCEFALALALLGRSGCYSSVVLGLASLWGSTLGAPVPGQLGIIEEALVHAAPFAGQSVATVLSIALLRRARSLLWVLIGTLFAFTLATGRGALPKTKPDAS